MEQGWGEELVANTAAFKLLIILGQAEQILQGYPMSFNPSCAKWEPAQYYMLYGLTFPVSICLSLIPRFEITF